MLSALLFQEVEDGLIDFFWSFPHGNMATFFNSLKLRTGDGLLEGFPHVGRKDEVPLSPDEQGGVANKEELIL